MPRDASSGQDIEGRSRPGCRMVEVWKVNRGRGGQRLIGMG